MDWTALCLNAAEQSRALVSKRASVVEGPVQAANEILSWGPTAVVAKLGKYGAALYTAGEARSACAA